MWVVAERHKGNKRRLMNYTVVGINVMILAKDEEKKAEIVAFVARSVRLQGCRKFILPISEQSLTRVEPLKATDTHKSQSSRWSRRRSGRRKGMWTVYRFRLRMNVHDSFALVYHPNIGDCVQSICLLLLIRLGNSGYEQKSLKLWRIICHQTFYPHWR